MSIAMSRPRRTPLIQSRFYNVRGTKWEARFFAKGETFPESDLKAPKQGVWARPITHGWYEAYFLGPSWGSVQLNPDLLRLPEKK